MEADPLPVLSGIEPAPQGCVSDIRLLFVSLPAMLSGIIRQAAATAPDLRVVDELGSLAELTDAVQRTRPHVVVVGTDEGLLPPECARSMYQLPHPGTLAISTDGRITSAYRLRPQGVMMENTSPTEIVEAIRALGLPPPELRDVCGEAE